MSVLVVAKEKKVIYNAELKERYREISYEYSDDQNLYPQYFPIISIAWCDDGSWLVKCDFPGCYTKCMHEITCKDKL